MPHKKSMTTDTKHRNATAETHLRTRTMWKSLWQILFFSPCIMAFGDLIWGIGVDDMHFGELCGVSLLTCVQECINRQHCKSINYYTTTYICQLNDKLMTESSNAKLEMDGIVYSDISTWPKNLPGMCASTICNKNEKCLSSNRSCLISECPEIPDLSNGRIKYSNTKRMVGSKTEFVCESQYVLLGNSMIECLRNGSWSDSIPQCRHDRIESLDLKGKATDQSSTYVHSTVPAVSSNAVDGIWKSIYFDYSCSSTNKQNSPWWYVDLGTPHEVVQVSILNRAEVGARLSNVDLKVGMTLDSTMTCEYYESPVANGAILNMACNPPKPGRFVYITLRKTDFLTMCEVAVYVNYNQP